MLHSLFYWGLIVINQIRFKKGLFRINSKALSLGCRVFLLCLQRNRKLINLFLISYCDIPVVFVSPTKSLALHFVCGYRNALNKNGFLSPKVEEAK